MNAFRSVRPLGHQRAVRPAGLVAFVLGLAATAAAAFMPPPAAAQTTSTVSPVDLRLNPVVQLGATPSALPIGGQLLQVIVSNSGSSPISNQQIVVRVPSVPAVITQVTEQNSPVGVVDPRSGFWYHTIAQLNAGATVTFAVTWYTPCPGRWPLVARVGDRRTSTSVQLIGNSSATCSPDELAAPVAPSYLELPWPPTTGAQPSVTSTTVGSTITTTTIAVTVPGASGPATSTTVAAPLPPVTPSVVATTTTVPRTTTTVKKPTTTTIIICKTIGGRRYCGPQSSVYKPGQKKAVETKPKPTTKKTTKK